MKKCSTKVREKEKMTKMRKPHRRKIRTTIGKNRLVVSGRGFKAWWTSHGTVASLATNGSIDLVTNATIDLVTNGHTFKKHLLWDGC